MQTGASAGPCKQGLRDGSYTQGRGLGHGNRVACWAMQTGTSAGPCKHGARDGPYKQWTLSGPYKQKARAG